MPESKIGILLIEDNQGDIRLIKESLKENGFDWNLEIITNGEDAINHFAEMASGKKEIPKLVLMDINLPRKSGIEVLSYVKTNELLRIMPVIMLTTSESDFDVKSCYAAGANAFMNKPIDYFEFVKIIKTFKSFWFDYCRLPKISV